MSFILGLIIGALLGMFYMCLVVAAKDERNRND